MDAPEPASAPSGGFGGGSSSTAEILPKAAAKKSAAGKAAPRGIAAKPKGTTGNASKRRRSHDTDSALEGGVLSDGASSGEEGGSGDEELPGRTIEEIMEEGSERSISEAFFRRPRARERRKTFLITKAVGDGESTCRVAAARTVLKGVADAHGTTTLQAGLGVWLEPCPKTKKWHHHIVLDFVKKHRRGAHYSECIARHTPDKKNFPDVRVEDHPPSGESGLCRVLTYVTKISTQKLVDLKPWTSGLKIPQKVVDKQRAGLERMSGESAKPDDIYRSVKDSQAQDADSWLANVEGLASATLENGDSNMQVYRAMHYGSILRWVSTLGSRWKNEVESYINRYRGLELSGLVGRGFAGHLSDASSSACACNSPGDLFKALVGSVEWHDTNEFYPENMQKVKSRSWIGSWCTYMIHNNFPDRETCLLMMGAPGSGKSTIVSALLGIVPGELKFSPDLDSSFPFDGFIPAIHRFVDWNDFSTSAKLSPTLVKLLTERRPGVACDQKGSQSVRTLKHRDSQPFHLFSLNNEELQKRGDWSASAVKTVFEPGGRCYPGGGIIWAKGLPKEMKTNAALQECRKCPSRFVQWCRECDDSDGTSVSFTEPAPTNQAAATVAAFPDEPPPEHINEPGNTEEDEALFFEMWGDA